jgi:DNA-binding HxlR family transcriptional regulator
MIFSGPVEIKKPAISNVQHVHPLRRTACVGGRRPVLGRRGARPSHGFNELQKQIPDISKKMLIQTLRNLERDGLLERTVYQQVPPKTEYRLTDNGHKLREPIAWLCQWGMENREFIDSIIEARARTVLMPMSNESNRPPKPA